MGVSRSLKGPITSCGRQSSLYGSCNKLWTLVVPSRILQHVVDVSCLSTRLQNDVDVSCLSTGLQNDVDVSRPSTRLIVAFLRA